MFMNPTYPILYTSVSVMFIWFYQYVNDVLHMILHHIYISMYWFCMDGLLTAISFVIFILWYYLSIKNKKNLRLAIGFGDSIWFTPLEWFVFRFWFLTQWGLEFWLFVIMDLRSHAQGLESDLWRSSGDITLKESDLENDQAPFAYLDFGVICPCKFVKVWILFFRYALLVYGFFPYHIDCITSITRGLLTQLYNQPLVWTHVESPTDKEVEVPATRTHRRCYKSYHIWSLGAW